MAQAETPVWKSPCLRVAARAPPKDRPIARLPVTDTAGWSVRTGYDGGDCRWVSGARPLRLAVPRRHVETAREIFAFMCLLICAMCFAWCFTIEPEPMLVGVLFPVASFMYTPIPSVSEKWLARAGGNDSCCGHDSRRLS
jgi:hypothetical protein